MFNPVRPPHRTASNPRAELILKSSRESQRPPLLLPSSPLARGLPSCRRGLQSPARAREDSIHKTTPRAATRLYEGGPHENISPRNKKTNTRTQYLL